MNFNENTSLESYSKEISFLNELVKKLHRHRYPNEILNFNTQLKKHWGDLSLSECWKISNVVFIELKDYFDAPLVTEISPALPFYLAEADHHDYYNQNSQAGYCRAVIQPKLTKLRSKYVDRFVE